MLLEKPASRPDDSEEADVPIHLRKDLPIWELHTQPSEGWVERGRQILDQCTLDAPDDTTLAGENPNPAVKGDITLVTALLDLGRGGETNGMFKRGMEEYFARFQRILDRGFPMVVYMPAEFREHLRIDEARVQVRELTVDGLKDEALFGPYWNAVQVGPTDAASSHSFQLIFSASVLRPRSSSDFSVKEDGKRCSTRQLQTLVAFCTSTETRSNRQPPFFARPLKLLLKKHELLN